MGSVACEAKFGEGARRPGEHNKNMSGGTGPGQCARMLSHLGMTPVRRHHNCVSCTHGTHREDLKAGGTTRGKKGRGTDPRKLSLAIVYPCSGTGRRKVGKARTPGTGGASGVALPSQQGARGPGGGGGAPLPLPWGPRVRGGQRVLLGTEKPAARRVSSACAAYAVTGSGG